MSSPVIDEHRWNQFVSILGGDGAAIKDVVHTFLDESQSLVTRLDEAFAAKDTDGIKRAAHTLKSVSRQFGLEELALRAAEIEGAADAGLPEARQRRDALQAALESGVDSLNDRLAAFE